MRWIHGRLGSSPGRVLRAVLLFTTVSAAMQAQAEPAAAPAKPQRIEEIVVSARAEAENVRNIPVAITAVSEQKLQDFNLTSMTELQQMTPQLRIDRASSGSGASISIRGLGSNSLSLGIEQSVAVIIDGVYYPQGRVINEGLNDVANVAILKGPQALYFGKNATAGVLSINTNNPTQEREAVVQVSNEFHAQEKKINAVLSGGVTDWLALRLAAQYSRMDQGDFENTAQDTTYITTDQLGVKHTYLAPRARKWWPQEETRYVRLTGAGNIDEHWSYNVKLNYGEFSQNSSTGAGERLKCFPANAANFVGSDECKLDFSRGINDVPPEIAATNSLLGYFGTSHAAGEEFISRGETATVNYGADKFDVKAIYNHHYQTEHWVGDQDGLGSVTIFAGEKNTFTNDALELRGVTHLDMPVNFVLGAYLQRARRDFDQVVNFAGAEDNDPSVALENRFTSYSKVSQTKGETWSVYGEVTWDITDTVQADAGVRYIHETKDSFFKQPYVAPYSFFPFLFTQFNPADPNTIARANKDYSKAVPEVTIRWRPTDNAMVYAAFKTGFKSGTFDDSSILSNLTTQTNGNPSASFLAKPETVRGGEIGTKVQLFDDAVSMSLDAFYYKYKDLQVDFFRIDVFSYFTENAGGSITKGAEFQGEWATPVEGLRISGSLGYLESYYTDFVSLCYVGQTIAAGCGPGKDFGSLPQQNLKGTTRPGAPKWSGDLAVRYERPLPWFNLVAGFAANMQFKGKTQLSSSDPTVTYGSYQTYDANFHVRTPDGHWELAFIGRNLTNKKAILGEGASPLSGGSGTGTDVGTPADQSGGVIRPRRYQLEATWRL